MVVRDRLFEFISLQKTKSNAFSRQKEIHATLPFENYTENKILEFLKKVEDINDKMAVVDQGIAEVIRIQSAILEFGEPNETLFTYYNDIKLELTALSEKISRLEKSFKPDKFSGSATELRICISQVSVLKSKLSSCVSNYYSIQEEYKDKCKARIRRQARIAGADLSKVDLDDVMTSKTAVFLRAAIPDYDVSHFYMQEVKKRHEEFLKLERSILELNELFYELSLILQVDFVVLDRVDQHIQLVSSKVQEGKHSVIQYRRATRIKKYKKWLSLGCVGILVGFILVVIMFLFI